MYCKSQSPKARVVVAVIIIIISHNAAYVLQKSTSQGQGGCSGDYTYNKPRCSLCTAKSLPPKARVVVAVIIPITSHDAAYVLHSSAMRTRVSQCQVIPRSLTRCTTTTTLRLPQPIPCLHLSPADARHTALSFHRGLT
jgi:hypothetical protein